MSGYAALPDSRIDATMTFDSVLLVTTGAERARDIAAGLAVAGAPAPVDVIDSPAGLREALAARDYRLVVVDHVPPSLNALETVDAVRACSSKVALLVLAPCGDADTLVEAMRRDADYYACHEPGTPVSLQGMACVAYEHARLRLRREACDQAHRVEKQRMRIAMEAVGAGVWELRLPERSLWLDAPAGRLLDAPPPGPAGLDALLELLPASAAAAISAQVEAMASGHARRLKHEMQLDNGRWLSCVAEVLPGDVPGSCLLVGMLRDVTTRRRNEQALERSRADLRRLAAGREQAVEEERCALSRELHDDLGQLLSAMSLQGQRLARQAQRQGATSLACELAGLQETVAEALDRTRRIAAALRPGVLDRLGLGAAVEWLTRDVCQQAGLRCQLAIRLPDDAPVAPALATDIFRILQEGLSNVVRHAGAHSVWVSLDRPMADTLRLVLTDDGVGLSAQAPEGGGLGLLGMRERAAGMHAELRIEGIPGSGTRLEVLAPMTGRDPS